MQVISICVALVCLVPAVFAVIPPRNPIGSRPAIIDRVSASLNPSPPITLTNKPIPPPRLVAPVPGQPLPLFRYPNRGRVVPRMPLASGTNRVLGAPLPPSPAQSPAAMTNRLANPRQPLPRPVNRPPPNGPMGLTAHDVANINNLLATFLTTPIPYYQTPTYTTFASYYRNFGRNSDCDCQQGQDRCQNGETYNGDCEDGVVCCPQMF